MPSRLPTRALVVVLALAAIALAGGSADPLGGAEGGRRWHDSDVATRLGLTSSVALGAPTRDPDGRRWR